MKKGNEAKNRRRLAKRGGRSEASVTAGGGGAGTATESGDDETKLDSAMRSNSSMVSSLYLLSLTAIIFALTMIIGLVSYTYTYHFTGTSAERIDLKHHSVEDDDDIFLDDVDLQDADILENVETTIIHDDADDDDKKNCNLNVEEKKPKRRKRMLYPEHRDLFHTYKYNYNKAQEQRSQAMKKYSYPYLLDGVDKRSNLSLQEFYDVYDGKWPVIVTDIISTWPAANWSKETFIKKYGQARVGMMAYNILEDDRGSKEGFSVQLEIFLQHLNVSSSNMWTYVQDEVFLVQYPELRRQVLDTIYTKEDYFQLFPREIRPWDCLLLWGTAYSRSTLHIDPYNWTGTNAVITGHKRWKLMLPGQDDRLSITPDAACGFPLQCQKYNSKYDTYNVTNKIKKKLKKLKFLEVDQMSGEMLFIPTGWYHQAFNVVPTLAVSGEIMNRNNYLAILEEIFHVNNLPRSILPRDVEKLSPSQLVEFVMSKMPTKILEHGDKWTKMAIFNLYHENPELEKHNNP